MLVLALRHCCQPIYLDIHAFEGHDDAVVVVMPLVVVVVPVLGAHHHHRKNNILSAAAAAAAAGDVATQTRWPPLPKQIKVHDKAHVDFDEFQSV